MPSSCVTSEVENADFPLGVWKIQKAGGSRLMESGARMRECHVGRGSVCRPSGEQVRTQLLTLKSHSRVDFKNKAAPAPPAAALSHCLRSSGRLATGARHRRAELENEICHF